MSDVPENKYWLEKVTPIDEANAFDKDYVSFMNEALVLGHRPYELSLSWCFGLGEPERRLVEFIFRGRGHQHQTTSGRYLFEVLLIERKRTIRLGLLFGIRDSACVVVAGIQGIRAVSSAWLAGKDLEQVLHSTQFFDRTNLSEPLRFPSDVSN